MIPRGPYDDGRNHMACRVHCAYGMQNALCPYLASLGCPIEQVLIKKLRKTKPKKYKIYTQGCFPMYNGPWDVSGIVNRSSDINFALGTYGICQPNIRKLKFQQCPQNSTTLLEESALTYYQIRTSAHKNDRKDRGITLWLR